MTELDRHGKPTPNELRSMLRRPATGRFRLDPAPEDFIANLTAPEDEGVLFQDGLDVLRQRATENNPLTRKADAPRITNKERVNVIFREIAREDDHNLATLLGTTFRAAKRWRETGSHSGRQGLVQNMVDVYIIAQGLTDLYPGEDHINRRIAALHTMDYDTGVSPMYLIRHDERDRALALVQKGIRRELKKP